MKKYYLMAIHGGNEQALKNLLSYYVNNIQSKIYDNYFFEFITLKNDHLEENLPTCFKLIKKLYNEKIDFIKLHFDYSLNGKGYNDAKNDFIKLLNI